MTAILLELDLTRGVLETPPASPLAAFRSRHLPTLRELVSALRKGATDEHVTGLVAHVGGPRMSLAQVQDLRDAVQVFRSSGKTAIWNIQGPSMSAGKLREHALKLALRAARAEALLIPAAYFCAHSVL